MNLPNAITIGRIATSPLIGVLPFFPSSGIRMTAFLLFLIAAVTDYYDGKLARSRNSVTNLGRLLDPLADKLLLFATLIPMSILMAPRANWLAPLLIDRSGTSVALCVCDADWRDPSPMVDIADRGEPRSIHDDLPSDGGAPWVCHRRDRPRQVEDGIAVALGGLRVFLVRVPPLLRRGRGGIRPAWHVFALFNGTVGALAMVGRGHVDAVFALAVPAPIWARLHQLLATIERRDRQHRGRVTARLHDRYQRRISRARVGVARDRDRSGGPPVATPLMTSWMRWRRRLNRTGAVITTGGLGPTADDRTRKSRRSACWIES